MESGSDSHRRGSQLGILRTGSTSGTNLDSHSHGHADRVKFDEEVIAEHDKDRGTRQKIDEPKTPYEEGQEILQDDVMEEEEADAIVQDQDVQMKESTIPKEVEEEVKKHLEEAERNKQLNAQLQKEQASLLNLHSSLTDKLESAQATQEEEDKKHEEFLKKRKEHYKNEVNAKMLLKQQAEEDEEDL